MWFISKIIFIGIMVLILTGCEQTTSSLNTKKEPEINPTVLNEPQNQDLVEDAKDSQIEVPSNVNQNNKIETYLVAKVIDGDTISLTNGQTVRYIGIDTPETVHPSKPVQCFGKEASNKNKELVEGKEVRLEKDVSETDRYGRLLRYVYVGDKFINDYLVRDGFAYSYSYPPDVKYQAQFVEAQKEARDNKRGLWSNCDKNTVTSPTPALIKTSTPIVEQPKIDSKYNCSANVYNCPSFKTQKEAQTAFEYCGGTANDIHKLDKDKDGVVCESLP